MRYLCLVYVDGPRFDALSEAEDRQLTKDSLAYDRALMASGSFVHANALKPPSTATTVRVRDGKVSMTDGPFAETKEHLGGFILVEASDLDAALAIAAKIPMARMGSIEVRPILDLE